HMLAVLNLLNRSTEPPVQTKEPKPAKEDNVNEAVNGLRMEIKRSVSPDGKINSLSVKVLYPIESNASEDIKHDTERLLAVVSDIVENFKGEDIKAPEQRSAQQNSGNGSVPAQILSVGGMKGTWGGRRLFLNFDVNGQTLKLFGTRNELA